MTLYSPEWDGKLINIPTMHIHGRGDYGSVLDLCSLSATEDFRTSSTSTARQENSVIFTISQGDDHILHLKYHQDSLEMNPSLLWPSRTKTVF